MNRTPDILLIVCDDLGYGDPACYGSASQRTPRIDALADGGLRLTDHYAAAPLCTPSRAGLMTGRHAHRVGLDAGPRYPVLLPGDDAGLDPGATTLADVLRSQGYATGCFGKWHLGDRPASLPRAHGFDSFFGLPYSHDMRPSHPAQAEFRFPPLPVMRDETVVETEPDPASLDARFTDAAIDFMRSRAAPRFVYLALTAPHVPLCGDYRQAVAAIDACVGRAVDALDRPEDTIVIFTSDHGARPAHGGSNGPFAGGKNTTLEGGMRVPCIVRWPREIPARSASSQLSSHLDILPTLAACAGAGARREVALDGDNILDAWRFPQRPTRVRPFRYYNNRRLEAIRHGEWKLHLRSGQLFNLSRDPGEAHDCAARWPNVVVELKALAESAQLC